MSSQQQKQQPADDWEEAADLSQQTSQMNISAQAPAFRPQANTFVPTGQQQFYPPQQYYQQGGYPQQQPMYGSQPTHPQYGPPYGYQQQGWYGGGYSAQYGSQQQFQPQVLQRGQNAPTQTKKDGFSLKVV